MQIERLMLTNFRGLINTEIDFKPGFNLIVGVNGAGKSSILEALRILLARAMPALTPATNFPGIGLGVEDITLGRNQVATLMALECHGQKFSYALTEQRDEFLDKVDKEKGFKDIRDAEGQSRIRRQERPEAGDPRLEGTIRGQSSQLPEVSGLWTPEPDAKLRKLPQQPLVLYLSVRRAIANGRVAKGQAKAPAYQSIFDIERGLELQGFMKWWEARDAIAKEDSKSRHARELESVKKVLTEVLPELSGWCVELDQLIVSKTVSVEQMDSLGQTVLVPDSRRLPLKLLSDGERSLIVIASDIARRIATLNIDAADPLASATGVVLIDEIDLHLHPAWQRRIAIDLPRVFPKLQFIATTHSPQVIGETEPGRAIVLREGGRVEVQGESLGRDSGWILRHVMHTIERNAELQAGLDEVDDLIDQDRTSVARERVSKLRQRFGDDKELVGAEAVIDRWETLGNEEDQ